MPNPYDVQRSWPDYFLEHRRETLEKQGTYRCGDLPVWTIYCPVGLLGNAIVIEGDDSLIVYDTGVNAAAGAHIAAEIRKLSDKPVKTIFYSHHHADHYNGTAEIVSRDAVKAGDVRIYAWENFERERRNEFGEILPRQAMGAAYYGGAFLAPDDRHHHGIGTLPTGGAAAFIPPTHFLSGDTELVISGVRLNVFYTGGEAISEFGVRLPDMDMVIIADEFFTGLANLHTIRGSKPRLPANYMAALDRVIEIRPDWLLGSHIMPLHGKDEIAEHVTLYRDAIQYQWDQAIRLINKGYTPIELQHALKDLPDHFWDPPFTVPMYGTPFTSVPEFFTGWVSWFSGDATDMFPTEPRAKATGFVDLMGGIDRVLAAAKEAHAAGNHQYAAELAQLALRAAPDNEDARLVKAAALRARGYQEINPIARSWYLTGAMELEGAFDPAQLLTAMVTVLGGDLTADEVVGGWRYQLDAAKAGTTRLTVGIHVSDTGHEMTVRLRNGILIVEQGIATGADAVVEATTEVLRAGGEPTTVSGDAHAFPTLAGFLDLSVTGFSMHMR